MAACNNQLSECFFWYMFLGYIKQLETCRKLPDATFTFSFQIIKGQCTLFQNTINHIPTCVIVYTKMTFFPFFHIPDSKIVAAQIWPTPDTIIWPTYIALNNATQAVCSWPWHVSSKSKPNKLELRQVWVTAHSILAVQPRLGLVLVYLVCSWLTSSHAVDCFWPDEGVW